MAITPSLRYDTAVSTIHEIEQAVQSLGPQDLAAFRHADAGSVGYGLAGGSSVARVTRSYTSASFSVQLIEAITTVASRPVVRR